LVLFVRGIRCLPKRSYRSRGSIALFQLGTDLPVAVARQRASAADRTDYAAEISRRTYR